MLEKSGITQTAAPANEYILSLTKYTASAMRESAENIPHQNAKRNGSARSVLPMEKRTSIILQANVHGARPAKKAIQRPPDTEMFV